MTPPADVTKLGGLRSQPTPLVEVGQFQSETIAMAVPKRKHTNSRTGSRRAHGAKKPVQLGLCPECSTRVPPHVVCPKCGHYMGRKVVESES